MAGHDTNGRSVSLSPTPTLFAPLDAASPTASKPTSATTKTTSVAPKKRTTSTASDSQKSAQKVTKRRAARACVSCRARKVRCDVVEGAPCGNCRWDNVECVVQESRRRKKNLYAAPATVGHVSGAEALQTASIATNNPISITSADLQRSSNTGGAAWQGTSSPVDGLPGLTYQQRSGAAPDAPFSTYPSALLSKLGDAGGRPLWPNAGLNQTSLLEDLRTTQLLNSLEDPGFVAQLPGFIKPLPPRIAAEDARYLHAKGALTLPSLQLQNALLQAYVEFVHPYMPLLELHEFLNIIHSRDGFSGQVSLFLYQAVMFVSTAFVGGKHLKEAGYSSRKAARRDFFHRTRLLYDFDYESDRLVLVQALLLMTYWYETPDDQKDTWHWMGVAISLAHTIGLHRNPANTNMPLCKKKLWKRIWWSCFMRDRLIALGMRRPTRIKDEDFDVPMLEEADFEIEALPDENQLLPVECTLVRDVNMQHELAVMCVQKAKLCICINHMLRAQYSVLNRELVRPENTTNSTMMLLPNKSLDNFEKVHRVDMELMSWYANLPLICQYRPLSQQDVQNGQATLAVQRNLLHMVYHTTVSALHRPQFLSSSPQQEPAVSRQVQDMSRMRVRDAANQITQMVAELHRLRLERYLPTSGVTVILPAMIIHLLEMKSPLPEARAKATKGFGQCMRVLEKLREVYAAADFATGFLDAALRKAAIDINGTEHRAAQQQHHQGGGAGKSLHSSLAPALNLALAAHTVEDHEQHPSTPPPENAPYLNATEVSLYHAGRTYMPRDANGNPAVIAGPTAVGHSPPPTETPSERAGDDDDDDDHRTPSAASGSLEETDLMDLDFGAMARDDFDWNNVGVAGSKLDFDQWLQFPAEGVGASDETFMGMFGTGAGAVEAQQEEEQQIANDIGRGMDWLRSDDQLGAAVPA